MVHFAVLPGPLPSLRQRATRTIYYTPHRCALHTPHHTYPPRTCCLLGTGHGRTATLPLRIRGTHYCRTHYLHTPRTTQCLVQLHLPLRFVGSHSRCRCTRLVAHPYRISRLQLYRCQYRLLLRWFCKTLVLPAVCCYLIHVAVPLPHCAGRFCRHAFLTFWLLYTWITFNTVYRPVLYRSAVVCLPFSSGWLPFHTVAVACPTLLPHPHTLRFVLHHTLPGWIHTVWLLRSSLPSLDAAAFCSTRLWRFACAISLPLFPTRGWRLPLLYGLLPAGTPHAVFLTAFAPTDSWFFCRFPFAAPPHYTHPTHAVYTTLYTAGFLALRAQHAAFGFYPFVAAVRLLWLRATVIPRG